MKLKVELSVEEIEQALKRYVAHKVTIAGYRPDDVQFVYDGQEGLDDYVYQQIDGAFVVLELSEPELKLIPASAETLAPEGWRSV